MAELTKAIQGWGTTDVTEAVGDPLLGLSSTVPALMPASPAPMTAAPLDVAAALGFPVERRLASFAYPRWQAHSLRTQFIGTGGLD